MALERRDTASSTGTERTPARERHTGGAYRAPPVALAARADSDFGRFHALVIGNQNYRHLKSLKTPLADARAVAAVLENKYGFEVELLLDKTREEIVLAIDEKHPGKLDISDLFDYPTLREVAAFIREKS